MDTNGSGDGRQAGFDSSRRRLLMAGGALLGGSVLARANVPAVNVADDQGIRLALIGCGGRGGGAVGDALSVKGAPVRLYAMADLFENRLKSSHGALSKRYGTRIDVPVGRQFSGFDAYKAAIDCLRPGDVAMLTAYAYCRPMHLEYAVSKGINVFMEKSFAPDPGGLRRVLAAGKLADQKGVRIAGGLMCRHSTARAELINKIRDGELGDIVHIKAGRNSSLPELGRRPGEIDPVSWQVRNKQHFLWVSSGRFIEYLIHQIDECCWIKDGWPVSARGIGGRVAGSNCHSQNMDTYAIEYVFADGTSARVDNCDMRQVDGGFETFLRGTKKAAQFSGAVHKPVVHTYRGQKMEKGEIDWQAAEEPCSPYHAEWNALISAILEDRPHNETERSVMANYASIMGRASVHTGKIVRWDEVTSSDFVFAPKADSLVIGGEAPVPEDENGRHPVPVPGKWEEI